MTKIVDDQFTDAASPELNSHTPDIAGDGWTKEQQLGIRHLKVNAGDGRLDANASSSGASVLYSAQPNPSDSATTEYDTAYEVRSETVSSNDDPFGVFARFTDTDNMYSAGTYRPDVVSESRIAKKVAGAHTELASGNFGAAGSFVAEVLIFKVRDSTDRQTFRDDTEALEITADDTALSAAGRCGVFIGRLWVATDDMSANWEIENFYWDDLAAVADAFEAARQFGAVQPYIEPPEIVAY